MNCIDCEYCGFVVPRRHWFQVETRVFKKIAQELSEHPWYKER